jgi:3-hydroxyisobutyrate dehydrogenase
MTKKQSATNKTIGVIGLGAMGTGIAQNLFKNNQLHFIFNRTLFKAQQFQKNTGISYCDSLSEFAGHCNVIITSVSTDSDIIEVINALLPNLNTGTTIIDTSTIGIDTVSECNALLARKKCFFLDAPVSGGSEGAKNGQLVMMVGGTESVLNSVRHIVNCFTKSVSHMGESGNGQKSKAVNQIMAAGINQAVTEALSFAQVTGLDCNKLIDLISGGAAGNWFLEHRGKIIIQGNYQPGFEVKLHHKYLLLFNKIIE